MTSKRVGVVMGGSSGEREVSLRSGQAVLSALQSRGYDAVPVVLGPTVELQAIPERDLARAVDLRILRQQVRLRPRRLDERPRVPTRRKNSTPRHQGTKIRTCAAVPA